MNYDRKFMYMLVICSSYLIDYQLFTNTDACHAYTHLQSQNMHEHTHTHTHTHTCTHTRAHTVTHTHTACTQAPLGQEHISQTNLLANTIALNLLISITTHTHIHTHTHAQILSNVVVFHSISCTSMRKAII